MPFATLVRSADTIWPEVNGSRPPRNSAAPSLLIRTHREIEDLCSARRAGSVCAHVRLRNEEAVLPRLHRPTRHYFVKPGTNPVRLKCNHRLLARTRVRTQETVLSYDRLATGFCDIDRKSTRLNSSHLSISYA